jgi:tetratricopeptide (TPR) repeat protein/DNA-binding beta-propeller fold protein YncE
VSLFFYEYIMIFAINTDSRHNLLFTLGLAGLLLGLVCGTAYAAEAGKDTAPFSKLQIDRHGNLYGLGPQQKTLFRIQLGKTGFATQQLIKRQHKILSFVTDEEGFMLLSDGAVRLFDRKGKELRTIGGDGNADQLDGPTAVTYSDNHRIYVAESGGDRVSVFARDGVFLFSFGNTGERSTRLKNPFAIFVDRDEVIYVFDERGKGRINIYAPNGQWIRSLTTEALHLAPFGKEVKFLAVIDQNGNLLAPGADGNSLVQYDWRQNRRQTIDQVSAAGVDALAYGSGQLVMEENNNIHSRTLVVSDRPTDSVPILDNIKSQTVSAPACSQAYSLPAGEVLCLNRKQGSLTRYSADGKPRVRYGGTLQKPSLLTFSKNRVAVVDNNGLKIFQSSGRLVTQYEESKRPQALEFVGNRLVLISKGKVKVFNQDGSVSGVDRTGLPSSTGSSRTRYVAMDSSGNFYTADQGDDEVHVENPQGGQSYLITRAEFSKIRGLAVDANDQLYILARHRDDALYIHVYRGLLQQFAFRVGFDIQPAGFSTMPAADTLLSVYDKQRSVFRQFQYQQAPTKIIDLKLEPAANSVAFSWIRSAEPYVNRYVLEAAESEGGPFVDVASTKNTQLDLRLADKRYRYFRVRAVARSGITGYPSDIVDNRFEAAYQAYTQNDFDTAIDQLSDLLLTDPENAAALEYLGRCLIETGQYDRALNTLRQLQNLGGKLTIAKILQAKALYRAGRYTQAAQAIKEIKNKSRHGAEQLMVCARIRLALDDNKGAQKCLASVIAIQPDDSEARLMLLGALDQVRQRSAINSQLSWLKNKAIQDNNSGLMASLANYFLDHGKYKEAKSWFRRSLKIKPGYLNARTGLIRMAIKQKHFNAARSIALSMVGDTDQRLDGYQQLGNVALNESRPGEAVLAYRKAAALDPSNPDVQLGLAKAFRSLKNFSQAKQALLNVLRANPGNAEALLDMALVRIAGEENQEAIADLYQVLRYQPRNIEARELLARVLEYSGQLHAATVQASVLCQINPSDDHTRQLADLYYKQGRLRLALAQYRILLHKQRNSVELNVRVGTIYHRLGQNVLARKVLEKAVRLDRKAETAQTVLAQVYSDLRLYKSALRTATRAFRLKPGADNRLLLESIKSDRDEYLRNKKLGFSLVIDKLALNPVYTTALSTSEGKATIGTLTISNRSNRDVSDITLRVYVGDFVDAGMVLAIPAMKPKSSTSIPLAVNLSSHIEELTEDQVKSVDVELGFSDKRGSRLAETSGILSIYGQHAADWDSSSLNHFLQDAGTLTIRRQANAGDDKKTGLALPVYLSPLVEAYSTILEYGMTIQEVPESEQRYLQYPVETLSRHHGSIADITMLLSSLLLSNGNRVAVAGSEKSPILLLSTGVSWEQRAGLGLADSAIFNYDGEAWIPLAMNRWPNGVAAMWSAGSRAASGADGLTRILLLNPGASVVANGAETGESEHPARKWVQLREQQQTYSLQSYLLTQRPQAEAQGSALQRARWYLEKNYYRHAARSFTRVLIENPYSYDAMIGAGDAYDALGSINRAVNFYRRASYIEPFDQASLNREIQALKKLHLQSQIDRANKKLQALATH